MRHPVRLFLAVLLLASGTGCAPTTNPPLPAPWFEDVTDTAGIDFEHVRGLETRYWFPEIMSGGAAWLDYDDDGFFDLYLVQGGDLAAPPAARPGNRLYRNHGDGTFTDVTASSLTGDTGYGMGAATGDYDGDGDTDLYVTNVGPNVLYRNNGDGTFTDVARMAGVDHPGWGTSAAFFDYDGDGDLDLFVVNYILWSPEREITCFSGGHARDYCLPDNYHAPAPDVLYRNNGDGTFTDVARAAGIATARGNGLGVAPADYDGDGDLDLYVANDGDPNHLWINQGDGTFRERALVAGAALNRQGMAEAGMGVTPVDLDDDGDLDLFLTHLREETNTVYLNHGGLFEDVTLRTGLAVPSLPYTGFGTAFADFDLDGQLDLYVTNGRVSLAHTPLADDPYAEPDQLFRGLGGGRFEEVLPPGGTAEPLLGAGRALAVADYDNDGDPDLLVVNNGGPARLLRNRIGDGGRWIAFRLLDRHGRTPTGALVGLEAGGRWRWRLAGTAYGYQAAHDPRVFFGLGADTSLTRLDVVWPGGGRETFPPPSPGAFHMLREGSGRPVPR